jgi:hypothetical protein
MEPVDVNITYDEELVEGINLEIGFDDGILIEDV